MQTSLSYYTCNVGQSLFCTVGAVFRDCSRLKVTHSLAGLEQNSTA